MTVPTIAIVTGASRGLGEAIALQLIRQGTPLITVARQTNPALERQAAEQNCPLTQLQADLSDPQAAQQASERVCALLPADLGRCILVNNAGTVEPIVNTASLTDARSIDAALTLNVTSVMLMCSAILQASRRAGADCRILNISSGAGRSPMPGWGVYCATKAALDMYTQVLAQEHPEVRVASIAPGVIDTAMQKTIRAADVAQFPNVERFAAMHQHGQLASPAETARHLVHYIDRDDFGTTVLDDIRHYS